MNQFVPACGESVAAHRCEQVRLRGSVLIDRRCEGLLEFLGRRQRHAVFLNESPNSSTVSFTAHTGSQQSKVQISPSLVPCTKRTGGDVLLDVLRRAPEPGIFL